MSLFEEERTDLYAKIASLEAQLKYKPVKIPPTLKQISDIQERLNKIHGTLRTFNRDREVEEDLRTLLGRVADYLEKVLDADTPEGQEGLELSRDICRRLYGAPRG